MKAGENKVDIRGLPKELVLEKLFKNAKVKGLKEAKKYRAELEAGEAMALLAKHNGEVSFHEGRVLSVSLRGDFFNPKSYDRYNGGTGTAAGLIEELRRETGIEGEEM